VTGPLLSGTEWSWAGWRVHLPGARDPGELASLAGRLGAATIPDLAAESARRFPHRVAVSVDGAPVTHAELDAAAGQVAGWLAARISPGDRVLLAAGASPGFLRCYLGALRAGAVVVLANPAYTAAELSHLVADSGAAIAFADPGPAQRLVTLGCGGLARGSRAPLLTVPVAELPGPADAGRPLAHRARPEAHRARPEAYRARPGDIALLAYTSGTTGRPKGVPLTHRALATSIRSAMAAWRWTADDVLVHALPLFHQHGLGGVHATLVAGSTAHIQSRFDPAQLIATVRREAATVLFGVPASYQALLDAARDPAAGDGGRSAAGPGRRGPGRRGPGGGPVLGGLRLAVCGSAPLSPALAAELPGLLGQLPVVRYGTTESGLDVSNPLGGARGETAGLPLPGVECRIWPGGPDGEARAETGGMGAGAGGPGAGMGGPAAGAGGPGAGAAAGVDGEIQLRGPQVFTGYWGNPAATEAAFTADGWFRTGDIGAVDPASGHLVIRGRIKELIITGGLNVHPREVEIALESHPAVAEAAVAGIPHPRWGEQVTAWVVPRPGCGVSADDLIAHARTRLAPYKCPKQVFPVAALPRTPLGKVNRSALTDHP
jgi:acyl-CoA synthetase (AMP-forming)/AMP-acid ligase II